MQATSSLPPTPSRVRKTGLLPSLVLLLLILAGCSATGPDLGGLPGSGDSAPARRLDPDRIADAVPRTEPRSRYGNPESYQVMGRRYRVMKSGSGHVERGIASWYGTKFHGRRTSSGEPYDMYAMTAAHKTLPLPSYVQVRNLDNGRTAVVKVNDRGPFHDNRIIDLSYAAATKLGILGKGTGLVEIRVIEPGQPLPAVTDSASAPAEKARPRLFVQVGAFSSQDNARQYLQRLRQSLDEPVRIQRAERDGQTLFRVQIGPLAGVTQADRVSERLTRIGITNRHVIIE